MNTANPHANLPVLTEGAPLSAAKGSVVLLHGRGGSAEDILSLSSAFKRPDLAYFAPQAAAHTWYPNSFLALREANEPYLTSALASIASVIATIETSGIPRERIVLAGFSQGACLSTEFIASHPARYAGLLAFTGGLIGPLGSDLHHPGSLAGVPAFFGSGDPDPHVPWQRVEESVAEYERMGAKVTAVRYPGRPHTITGDEIQHARRLLQQAFPVSEGAA